MRDSDPGHALDEAVVNEILRVKERADRSERRLEWVVIAAFVLGFFLLIVGIAIGVTGRGVSAGPGLASLVMMSVGGVLIVGATVAITLYVKAAEREFLSGGKQGGIEGHYRGIYPAEYAEAESREKASERRRAQEAALAKGAAALQASRGAIARERRREKRGVGQ